MGPAGPGPAGPGGRWEPGVKSKPAAASSARTRSESPSGVSPSAGFDLRPSAQAAESQPFLTRWEGSRPGWAARHAASIRSRLAAVATERFDNSSTAGRACSISPSAPRV